MKTAAFNATCPYEIGDQIQVLQPVAGLMKKDGAVYMIGKATITDIACTHYVKTGRILFTYELDGSGEYIPLITAREAGLWV